MFQLIHGIPWSHTVPAFVALLFALLYLKSKNVHFRILFGVLWLLFFPNTIYIFTDLSRVALHWNTTGSSAHLSLVIQYFILEVIGILTFIFGFLPFESIIHTKHFSFKKQIYSVILFNFIIGFGMVLGRVEHINSYFIFTQPIRVLSAVLHIIASVDLWKLTILYGIIANLIYFLFRKYLLCFSKSLLIPA